jgi:hypothetical protein
VVVKRGGQDYARENGEGWKSIGEVMRKEVVRKSRGMDAGGRQQSVGHTHPRELARVLVDPVVFDREG